MTRRDFEFIAATIRNLMLHDDEIEHVARAFADRLAGENPRFDRARFIAACSIRVTA